MGRIQVLPDSIANKIAAGEVVERPASVAKELLENALDAGATRLRIEIEAGGRRLVQIADNGSGMGRDDAMLAFERHATSKLRQPEDLLSIATLGFRGEALPSIASISRLWMETRSENEDTGTRVEIAGGRMLNVTEAVLPAGTTIAVRDLFYNMPARRKFLRSEKTELAHVASLVTHYSLAHPGKSFHLSHDKGVLLNVTPVASRRERVFQVFGSGNLDHLVEFGPAERVIEEAPSPVPPTQAAARAREAGEAQQRHIYRIGGFVSTAHVQKLNRNSIYIFVNGRLIRDRVLLKAISSAYHNVIPPGTFPFALLFLDVPFGEVDVNVHPSKVEVRFRRQSFMHDFVRDTIRESLIASKPASTFPMPAPAVSPPQPATEVPYSESTLRLGESGLPPEHRFQLKPGRQPAVRFDFSANAPIDFHELAARPASPAAAFGGAAAPAMATLSGEGAGEELPFPSQPHAREPLVDVQPDSLSRLGQLRPLGQLRDSFIVATGPDGLWIIDQHVAHERILFEKVVKQRAAGAMEAQRLLLPIIVSLQPEQEINYNHIEEELRANAFDIEPFGRRTIAVKAAPAGLSPKEVETLLGEILDSPEKELRELSLEELRNRVAATIACHAAIKVNMPLEAPKVQWLLDELAKTDCPMACPHGRPIALKYPLRDILKAFHRI